MFTAIDYITGTIYRVHQALNSGEQLYLVTDESST